MANELKPCPFCSKPLSIRGGVNPYGRCNTEGCWMMEAKLSVVCDDPKQAERWNTRPAAPVEGLERYDLEDRSSFNEGSYMRPDETGDYVLFSQAEAIIAAERAERLKWMEEGFATQEIVWNLQADNAALTARVKTETELREDHQARNKELETQLAAARKALEPFALISSEGVISVKSGHVTVTTCAEYFHEARAALEAKP